MARPMTYEETLIVYKDLVGEPKGDITLEEMQATLADLGHGTEIEEQEILTETGDDQEVYVTKDEENVAEAPARNKFAEARAAKAASKASKASKAGKASKAAPKASKAAPKASKAAKGGEKAAKAAPKASKAAKGGEKAAKAAPKAAPKAEKQPRAPRLRGANEGQDTEMPRGWIDGPLYTAKSKDRRDAREGSKRHLALAMLRKGCTLGELMNHESIQWDRRTAIEVVILAHKAHGYTITIKNGKIYAS